MNIGAKKQFILHSFVSAAPYLTQAIPLSGHTSGGGDARTMLQSVFTNNILNIGRRLWPSIAMGSDNTLLRNYKKWESYFYHLHSSLSHDTNLTLTGRRPFNKSENSFSFSYLEPGIEILIC